MIDGHVLPRVAALVVLALGLAACGEGDVTGGGSAQAAESAATDAAEAGAAVAGTSALPVVDVIDLATGESTPLAALLPADRPLLLWFWAPW